MQLRQVVLSILLASCVDYTARAQTISATPLDAHGHPTWAAGAVEQAQKFSFLVINGIVPEQATPLSIPETLTTRNAFGSAESLFQQGPISTQIEPFFQALGTNNRTCATCHQFTAGWTITPKQIKTLYSQDPHAPLFTPIDGAVCPTASMSTPREAAAAYSLLINWGLIRVGITMPPADVLQFSVTAVRDPYDCTSNPQTGLTSPTAGIVSEYRRPRPSANLVPFGTETCLMWDCREPNLLSQANDAVLIHEQAAAPASQSLLAQAVALESGIFGAQLYDKSAGFLNVDGGMGGPLLLSMVPFELNENPPGPDFNSATMSLYVPWNDSKNPGQPAIARGQNLFNEKPINITGVVGINDVAGKASVSGTCSACHNTQQVGNHSSLEVLNEGTALPPSAIASGKNVDVSALPVFTVHCDSGPLAGTVMQVTDLGRGGITGLCADVGKFQTSALRNLAARAPYFHNGMAPDLAHLVEFYDERFHIGFTAQEESDLVAFLASL